MSIVLTDRDLRKFLKETRLEKGAHSPDHTFCVMEAVAFVAGEKWSDHPPCASTVIGEFLRSWNDALNDEDRQILKPLIPKLVGTNADAATERRRSWMALDWYCRISAPMWLDAAGLKAEAKVIRATAPIVDAKSAKAAQESLNQARSAASAARDAAWAVVWAAAGAAARDAAWAAARDAAGAAARAVVGAAARDAAWAALRPTVVKLQTSAIQLVERMIAA